MMRRPTDRAERPRDTLAAARCRYAVASQIAHHGFDPNTELIELKQG